MSILPLYVMRVEIGKLLAGDDDILPETWGSGEDFKNLTSLEREEERHLYENEMPRSLRALTYDNFIHVFYNGREVSQED